MRRLYLIVILPLLAWSCATAPEAPVVVETDSEPEATVEVPERAIPEESLYPLLVAEFALRRRAYEVALDQYMEQSSLLEDAGISAHTTHLAQFMQREPEALEAVQQWVALEPDNIEANNTLATLLVRRGRTVEAIPHVAVVARSGSQTSFPMLLNGFRQLTPEQQAELVDGINSLAQEFPDDPQLILTQALIHEELGQNEQALAKLDQLFAIEPYQQQAVLLEAKLLVQNNRKDPFKRMRKALAENPGDSRLRLQYARLLTRDDMDEARKQFEILSAQNPEDADLLFSLALINRETGDNLAAKAYLQQMVKLGEREDEAHYYLGRIAEDEGDLKGALYKYKQVSAGRDFLPANNRIGRILMDAGQVEETHQYFSALRDREPEQRESLYALEAELLNSNDLPEAGLAILDQGLSEFPDSTNLLYSRSMLAEQMGDLTTMESDLRTILAKDPDNATALNALGYTLANRTDRYVEARDLIARALVLQPGEPAILDSMGWVLYRQGEYEEALDYLRQAYDKFPDPEVAAHLGEVLWVSGDEAGAMEIWQAALLKDPDHEVLVATIKRLGITALDVGH